jgi:aspartyl-tRNA(Asn)/glutamyl-tRNA(Gln) amidotransferase subunit A
MNLDTLTIEEFGRKLRAREISSIELTNECLKRIAAGNATLNAFILVMAEEARRQAGDADRELAEGRDRGPLHGIPASVKDLFDIGGAPTTAASRVRDGHVAGHDAPSIRRLRQAGAVLIGKTNLHEFAFGTTNEDSAFGPARNPHDTSRSPGGSSGGSAASVAAGMALASLGSDTGGSIRIPAAACGIVGLKPTYDEIPLDGVVPLSRILDHAGPLTRTVTDAWHVYHALIGRPEPSPLAAAPIADLCLAVPRPYFCDLLDDEIRAAFEVSLDALRAAGARIDETTIGNARHIAPIYLHIVFGDAAAYHAPTLETMPDRYTAPVRMRLETARYVLAEDYVRALAGREILRQQVDTALSGCDALALPTLPIPAPSLGAASVRVGSTHEPVRNLMLRLTQLFNLTGHPAISLPCGRTSAGLPCGLQLVGVRGETEGLLRVARAVERQLDISSTAQPSQR